MAVKVGCLEQSRAVCEIKHLTGFSVHTQHKHVAQVQTVWKKTQTPISGIATTLLCPKSNSVHVYFMQQTLNPIECQIDTGVGGPIDLWHSLLSSTLSLEVCLLTGSPASDLSPGKMRVVLSPSVLVREGEGWTGMVMMSDLCNAAAHIKYLHTLILVWQD